MEDLKTRPEIISLVEEVARDQGIANGAISDVKTNQKGEGYLGQIFMVTVKDSEGDGRLEMVIKAAFTDDKVRQMVPIRLAFLNELFFYTTVYPTFGKLERRRGGRAGPEIAPKCSRVDAKEKQEMLVLENLKVSGFEIFDKTRELDHDHVKLIFETYGRFHGYSYVLRDQEPEKYQKIVDGLCNIYSEFNKNEFFGKYLIDNSKTVGNTLIPGEDDEVIEKFKRYIGQNILNIFDNLCTIEVDCPAILHGDCWSNNMMFKYQDTSDGRKPIDMRLIDWQIIKVGSPVCDLSYCLYSGGSKEVYDNLNDYLRIYHSSFSKCLKDLGSDPEKLFPFSKLKEHWKKFAKWGMIMSFAVLRMKLTHKEDIIDLTDGYDIEEFTDVLKKVRFDEEDYNKRIRNLLRHMHELNAL